MHMDYMRGRKLEKIEMCKMLKIEMRKMEKRHKLNSPAMHVNREQPNAMLLGSGGSPLPLW